jgi:hypothetical protein
MTNRQWTIGEVAAYLQFTQRHIRNLPIPFARIGRCRRYDPRDVEAYVQGCKCLSSNAVAPLSGKPRSSSKAFGLSEALAQAPDVKPSNSNARSEISFGAKLRSRGGRQLSPLTRRAGGTGSNTDAD